MKSVILLVNLFLLAFSVHTAKAQEFKPLINRPNATESISKKDVSKIFFTEQIIWPDGTVMLPNNLKELLRSQMAFYLEVNELNACNFPDVWQQTGFYGSGSSPFERFSVADITNLLGVNSKAFGYVSTSAETTIVKELEIR